MSFFCCCCCRNRPRLGFFFFFVPRRFFGFSMSLSLLYLSRRVHGPAVDRCLSWGRARLRLQLGLDRVCFLFERMRERERERRGRKRIEQIAFSWSTTTLAFGFLLLRLVRIKNNQPRDKKNESPLPPSKALLTHQKGAPRRSGTSRRSYPRRNPKSGGNI